MAKASSKPRSFSAPYAAQEAYEDAVARAILSAADALSSKSGSVGRRRLVNHLRGNQLPRDGGDGPAPPCFGLLESHRAGWVDDAVEALVESGHLQLAAAKGAAPPGLVPSEEGRGFLGGKRGADRPALPVAPRLGSHPEVEARLRELRRELADAEGRAPYGVFPNATLAAMATRAPRTLAELAEVRGLGEARIRKYGRRILRAIGAEDLRDGPVPRRRNG
jgi:superfamily II DNA helicase RecQ